MPGLLAATAANGIMSGMFQAAQDSHRGVMDRFRTMQMSRAAVPLGQTAADLLITAAGTVPLALVGLAVGWRVKGGGLALRTVAEWNPICAAAGAVRDLCGNAAPAADAAWPVAHPVAGTIAWSLALLAVFVPLAVRKYANSGR